MKTDPPDRVTLREVEDRSPETLTPYRFRYLTIPGLLSEDQVQLESSIGQYGVSEPLIILADHRIVDGHHRHAIALKLGLARVPVRIAAFADPFAIEWYAAEAALVRRHLAPARKLRLAEALARAEAEHPRLGTKPLPGRLDALPSPSSRTGNTLQRIATTMGLSTRVAEQIKTIVLKGPPGRFERLARGEFKPDAASRQTIEAVKKGGPQTRDSSGRTPLPRPGRRPVRRVFKPAAPPPGPRMPEATPAAVREIETRVIRWIQEPRRRSPEEHAIFWERLGLVVSGIDELVEILNQAVRGDPALLGAFE